MITEDPQRLELHKLLEGASRQLLAEFEATRLIPHRGIKGEEREEAVKHKFGVTSLHSTFRHMLSVVPDVTYWLGDSQ